MTDRQGAPLRLGTRASKLAIWQAKWVAGRLQAAGQVVELVRIRTQGDKQQAGPIATIGSQGVFTKELQRALLDGQIDLAVHSMKDLPTIAVEGLTVAAVPEREAVRDAFVSPRYASLGDLPRDAVVGTGSARRRAQLLAHRSDLHIRDLRGNLGTRIEKLDRGDFDAIILAQAGLRRLELADRITQVLPLDLMLPAPAQGALAIECRADDATTLEAASMLDHPSSRAAVTAERAALRKLEGGCLAAMGAHAMVAGDRLKLSAVVLSEDGSQRLLAKEEGQSAEAVKTGELAAVSLLEQGAAKLLRERE